MDRFLVGGAVLLLIAACSPVSQEATRGPDLSASNIRLDSASPPARTSVAARVPRGDATDPGKALRATAADRRRWATETPIDYAELVWKPVPLLTARIAPSRIEEPSATASVGAPGQHRAAAGSSTAVAAEATRVAPHRPAASTAPSF